MREHWRELDYWWWVWRERVPSEAKIALGTLLVGVLLAGGWFAADRMTSANASVASTDDFILETTVKQVVTVHERGKVVRKLVPVVKRVRVKVNPKTVKETIKQTQLRYTTRVVTVPGKARVVRRVVTTFKPVVKKSVVTVKGKTHTVVQTRLVPTTRVQTQTQVLTQTQTQTRAVTTQQTVTNVQPPVTVKKTETTTLPPVTSTMTKTETQTQTQTVTTPAPPPDTVTVTTTITAPAPDPITITITTTP